MPAPRQEGAEGTSTQQLQDQTTRFERQALDTTIHDLGAWQAIPQVQPLERQELARAAAEGRRDDFLASARRAVPEMDLRSANRFFDSISLAFNQHLAPLINGNANEAIRRRDETATDYWLAQSAENGHARERLGEAGAQAANLMQIGQGLTAQQKEDMLRAAIEAGFSYTAVRTAANNLGVAEPAGRTREDAMRGALESSAMELAEQIMLRMREILESYARDKNPQNMQEYERELQRLGYLLGEGPAKRIEALLRKQESESDEALRQTIATQIELARRLHSGEEGGVVPIVDTRRRS